MTFSARGKVHRVHFSVFFEQKLKEVPEGCGDGAIRKITTANAPPSFGHGLNKTSARPERIKRTRIVWTIRIGRQHLRRRRSAALRPRREGGGRLRPSRSRRPSHALAHAIRHGKARGTAARSRACDPPAQPRRPGRRAIVTSQTADLAHVGGAPGSRAGSAAGREAHTPFSRRPFPTMLVGLRSGDVGRAPGHSPTHRIIAETKE
jgi:hypothetical protein